MFGELIREYRKAKRKTQEIMACDLDISTNHLSRIERGKSFPSGDLIQRMLNIVSQDIEILSGDFDNKELYGLVVMIHLQNLDSSEVRLVFHEIMRLIKLADGIKYDNNIKRKHIGL